MTQYHLILAKIRTSGLEGKKDEFTSSINKIYSQILLSHAYNHIANKGNMLHNLSPAMLLF